MKQKGWCSSPSSATPNRDVQKAGLSITAHFHPVHFNHHFSLYIYKNKAETWVLSRPVINWPALCMFRRLSPSHSKKLWPEASLWLQCERERQSSVEGVKALASNTYCPFYCLWTCFNTVRCEQMLFSQTSQSDLVYQLLKFINNNSSKHLNTTTPIHWTMYSISNNSTFENTSYFFPIFHLGLKCVNLLMPSPFVVCYHDIQRHSDPEIWC